MFLLASLLVAPSAAAQLVPVATSVTAVLDSPSGPLVPGTVARVPLHLSYTYGQGSAAVQPTTVHAVLSVYPGWTHPHSTSWDHDVTVQITGGTATWDETILLDVPFNAGANQTGRLKVEVTAPTNGNLAAASDATSIALTTVAATGNTTGNTTGNATGSTGNTPGTGGSGGSTGTSGNTTATSGGGSTSGGSGGTAADGSGSGSSGGQASDGGSAGLPSGSSLAISILGVMILAGCVVGGVELFRRYG